MWLQISALNQYQSLSVTEGQGLLTARSSHSYSVSAERVKKLLVLLDDSFGLTGFEGGQLKQIQQDGLHVELNDMGMVESIHLCLFHWVLNDVFARINQQGRYAQQ